MEVLVMGNECADIMVVGVTVVVMEVIIPSNSLLVLIVIAVLRIKGRAWEGSDGDSVQ